MYISFGFFLCLAVLRPFIFKFQKRYREEKKKSEENIRVLEENHEKLLTNNNMLLSLKTFQTAFFLADNLTETFDKMLSYLLKITESDFGYLGEVLQDHEGKSFLKTNSITNFSRSKESKEFYKKDTVAELAFKNLKTLLEYTLSTEKPIISNTASTYSHQNGIPEGDHEISTFMGLPVFYNGSIVGIIGVANRLKGYDEKIIHFLEPFLATYGTIVQNFRLRSEQKDFENQLKEAKEIAEKAIYSKELFFTNISHELRTPLTLILSPISALISRGIKSYSDKQVDEILHIVRQNSKKLLTLIDEIMTLSKLSSGTQWTISEEPAALNSFFGNIFTAFKYQAADYDIHLEYHFLLDKRTIALVDAIQISKIIDNLLSNALKFTPKGGTVKLNVYETRIDNNTRRLNVEVEDNGVGISAEDMQHIFERFYQVKNQLQSSVLGSGVGLALAKELAVLMGGDLYVCSAADKGSSFLFSLPLSETKIFLTDSMLEDIKPEKVFADNLSTILIVEDNLVMRQFLKNILSPYYNIISAENGAVAYSLLLQKKETIQLVITDVMMPVMDGLELFTKIKSDLKNVDIPVIMLTANSDENDRLKMLNIGVDSYITKPFSLDELLANIRNVIENYYSRLTWRKGIEIIEEQEVNISEFEQEAGEEELSGTDTEWIAKASAIVEENIDNVNFDVDELAQKMMVSKRQLYRFVKKHIGLTPLNFIREIRLQNARERLENKSFKTLTELCNTCGFQSLQHFNRMYFERFGKKPSEYR
jgi:signal transduction histidine kinase/DNA-binding response OmpR family regulator